MSRVTIHKVCQKSKGLWFHVCTYTYLGKFLKSVSRQFSLNFWRVRILQRGCCHSGMQKKTRGKYYKLAKSPLPPLRNGFTTKAITIKVDSFSLLPMKAIFLVILMLLCWCIYFTRKEKIPPWLNYNLVMGSGIILRIGFKYTNNVGFS